MNATRAFQPRTHVTRGSVQGWQRCVDDFGISITLFSVSVMSNAGLASVDWSSARAASVAVQPHPAGVQAADVVFQRLGRAVAGDGDDVAEVAHQVGAGPCSVRAPVRIRIAVTSYSTRPLEPVDRLAVLGGRANVLLRAVELFPALRCRLGRLALALALTGASLLRPSAITLSAFLPHEVLPVLVQLGHSVRNVSQPLSLPQPPCVCGTPPVIDRQLEYRHSTDRHSGCRAARRGRLSSLVGVAHSATMRPLSIRRLRVGTSFAIGPYRVEPTVTRAIRRTAAGAEDRVCIASLQRSRRRAQRWGTPGVHGEGDPTELPRSPQCRLLASPTQIRSPSTGLANRGLFRATRAKQA